GDHRDLLSRERGLVAGDGEVRHALRRDGDLLRPEPQEVRCRPVHLARPGVTEPSAFDRDVRVTIAECIRERGAVPALAEDAVGAPDGVVMQFALPAREWWKDIVFT